MKYGPIDVSGLIVACHLSQPTRPLAHSRTRLHSAKLGFGVTVVPQHRGALLLDVRPVRMDLVGTCRVG